MKSKSPWETITSKVIFKNPWISLRQDKVIAPSGKPGTYTTLEAKPFVIIVAIDDDNDLLMIKQYRYPIEKNIIEFPAGGLKHDEDSLTAAMRELKEETGYEAKQWDYIGEFYELVSISRQKGHLFVARQLHDSGKHAMDEDGIEKQFRVSIKELEKMIRDGNVIDALTPAVLYKVKLHLNLTV